MKTQVHMGRRLRVCLLMAFAAALALLLALMNSERSAKAQDFEAQVVGGEPVPDGKYPFMAALLNTSFGNKPSHQQFCGGTLIDEDSVLTAAHCVENNSPVSPHLLRVTVGRTVLDSDQGQVFEVSRVFLHPNYDSRAAARDVAVLKLDGTAAGTRR